MALLKPLGRCFSLAPLRSLGLHRPGLTLAEVMVSVGLLSMVLLLLVGVFVAGLQLMQRSEVHTAASTIGREILETIKDEGAYAALPLQNANFNGLNPDAKIDGFPPDPYPRATRDGREFVIRVEVLHQSPRMAAVLVTVGWGEGRIQLEKVFHAADAAL